MRSGATPFPGAIPIVVVTGALGAGKTTLMKHLLESTQGAKSAVIVNEFAELGIDQHLMGGGDVTLLGNGCFCCRGRDDLRRALASLFEARRAGRVPDLTRVLIETSGLADPSEILLSLAADEEVGRQFHVQTILTLVDATLASTSLLASPEGLRQLALADLVAITKADLAGLDMTDATRTLVEGLSPGTPLLDVRQGAVDAAVVLARPDLGRELSRMVCAPMHDTGIAKHVLIREEAWEWEAFAIAMEALSALRAPDILRVKGLIHVRGRDRPVVYHRVQHLAHRPTELDAWPDQPLTQLVFITRNLAGDDIERAIDALMRIGR